MKPQKSQDSPGLVLASASPKRHEILNNLNLRFTFYSPKVRELEEATTPKKLVKENALLKLNSAKEKYSHHFIIAADTVVVSGNEIFFKPKNLSQGNKMLRDYIKNSHANKNYVITGLAVYSPKINKTIIRTDTSKFKISSLPISQLEQVYHQIFSTRQSGGFSIENWGSALISSINGSYYNVLGLPVHTLIEILNDLGTDIKQFIKPKSITS